MPDLITSTNFNAFIVHKWTYGRHICWLAFCQRSLLSITIKWERIYFLAVIRVSTRHATVTFIWPDYANLRKL